MVQRRPGEDAPVSPAALDALASRLADVEASARELNRLWDVTAALGRGQVEHERALADHLKGYREFARWADVRLDRLTGLVVRVERRKHLGEYRDALEKINSQVANNDDVQSVFAIDRLRRLADKIETLFEVKGIRKDLGKILEIWDRDCRAGRIKEDEARWILFQSQKDALIEAIDKLERSSVDEDYEAHDAMLTHR